MGTAIIAFVAGIAVGGYLIPGQVSSQFGGFRFTSPVVYQSSRIIPVTFTATHYSNHSLHKSGLSIHLSTTMVTITDPTTRLSVSVTGTLSDVTSNVGGSVSYNLYAGLGCRNTPIESSQVTARPGSLESRSFQIRATNYNYTVQAHYDGDQNNEPATSQCVGLYVTQQP